MSQRFQRGLREKRWRIEAWRGLTSIVTLWPPISRVTFTNPNLSIQLRVRLPFILSKHLRQKWQMTNCELCLNENFKHAYFQTPPEWYCFCSFQEKNHMKPIHMVSILFLCYIWSLLLATLCLAHVKQAAWNSHQSHKYQIFRSHSHRSRSDTKIHLLKLTHEVNWEKGGVSPSGSLNCSWWNSGQYSPERM